MNKITLFIGLNDKDSKRQEKWAKARLNQESIAVEVSAPAVQFI